MCLNNEYINPEYKAINRINYHHIKLEPQTNNRQSESSPVEFMSFLCSKTEAPCGFRKGSPFMTVKERTKPQPEPQASTEVMKQACSRPSTQELDSQSPVSRRPSCSKPMRFCELEELLTPTFSSGVIKLTCAQAGF